MVSCYGSTAETPLLQGDFLATYNLGSLVLPALVIPAPGDTLTVMFHTAVDRARVNLPLFQRVRYQRELTAGPIVAFGDPTLDLSRELRLGWYLGTEDIDLPRSIGAIVTRLASSMDAYKIVLEGGSGGGFAALQVGAHIPGSHVMAANPQTDLRKYNVRAYRAAMTASFGIKDAGSDPQLLPRIDAAERIISKDATMSVTLVMNSGDIYHERHHAAPFRKAVSKSSNVEIIDVPVDLGAGHQGINNELYGTIMTGIYDRIGSERA
ncbi:hypothetical protein BF93_16530 [Brachybacterium phenoliresistens]|uniref:Alpha/beta hydrolase n=2 Tax=Brachybacterium phenoliresistens TaxID=396014 RepID=Z9JUU8_9MICO|nr:hypothetical protein BF93_16530 [Brachybacterium phenoliresistens]